MAILPVNAPAKRRRPLLPPRGKGRYETLKTSVKLKPGQSFGFSKGSGYYARGVPSPVRRPAPSRVAPSPTRVPVANPLLAQAQTTVQGLFSTLIQKLAQERIAAEARMRQAYEAHGQGLQSALQDAFAGGSLVL